MMLLKTIVTFSLIVLASAQLQEEHIAPKPYSFSFTANNEDGSLSAREETSDANGRITGWYIIKGLDGQDRRVDYVADEEGFRAQVTTNEVSTITHQVGDAFYQSGAPTVSELRAAWLASGGASARVGYGTGAGRASSSAGHSGSAAGLHAGSGNVGGAVSYGAGHGVTGFRAGAGHSGGAAGLHAGSGNVAGAGHAGGHGVTGFRAGAGHSGGVVGYSAGTATGAGRTGVSHVGVGGAGFRASSGHSSGVVGYSAGTGAGHAGGLGSTGFRTGAVGSTASLHGVSGSSDKYVSSVGYPGFVASTGNSGLQASGYGSSVSQAGYLGGAVGYGYPSDYKIEVKEQYPKYGASGLGYTVSQTSRGSGGYSGAAYLSGAPSAYISRGVSSAQLIGGSSGVSGKEGYVLVPLSAARSAGLTGYSTAFTTRTVPTVYTSGSSDFSKIVPLQGSSYYTTSYKPIQQQ